MTDSSTNYEPGDEYDCDACGSSHEVRRGKGVRVAGSTESLEPSLYVRCPEAGVVALSDDGDTRPRQADEDWP